MKCEGNVLFQDSSCSSSAANNVKGECSIFRILHSVDDLSVVFFPWMHNWDLP